MRVLVAGRNAKVLAKAAGTFANDLEIHTAATKAACLALLGRVEFDLVVACETLADGSGLEVLSHVAVNTPNTLRIFAARPATLVLLKGELGLFGLFRTLSYPINFRKLWAAIRVAREACVEERVVMAAPPPVQHVVLEETWGGADLGAVTATKPGRPPIAPPRAVTAMASQPQKRQAPTATATATAPKQATPARSRAATSAPQMQAPAGQRPPAHRTAAGLPTQHDVATPAKTRPTHHGGGTTAGAQRRQQHASTPDIRCPSNQDAIDPASVRPVQLGSATRATRSATSLAVQVAPNRAPMRGNAQPPARQHAPLPTRVVAAAPRRQPRATAHQEVTSGMRAAARYAAAHAGKASGAAPPARIPESDAFKRARARRAEGRLEPIVSNESLAQLAKLAITSRPNPTFRGPPAAKHRAALFVGSGVFAATTAAVLTFFMVSANNSVKHPKMPVIASITDPVPHKVFPWQPEMQQPTRQAAFMRSEAPASAVADLEAEAEAASESSDGDPDHPGPPPPNAPPPPSEPPSEEGPAQWVDE